MIKERRIRSASNQMLNPVGRAEYILEEAPSAFAVTKVENINYDVVVDNTTGGNTVNTFNILFYDNDTETFYAGSVTSLDVAIANITQNTYSAKINYVSNGNVVVTITDPLKLDSKYAREMKVVSAGIPDCDVKSFAVGSLSENAFNNIAAMVFAKTPSRSNMKLFSNNSYDINIEDAVINPNLFIDKSAWDISGVVIGITSPVLGSILYYPSLVSPRHVLAAYHVGFPVGYKLMFKSPTGVYTTCTVLEVTQILNADLSVLYLDQTPVGCAIYKTFSGDDWRNYARSLDARTEVSIEGSTYYYDYGCLPVIRFGAHYTGAYALPTATSSYIPSVYRENTVSVQCYIHKGFANPAEPKINKCPSSKISSDILTNTGYTAMGGLNDWMIILGGGDSGSPSFVPIDTVAGGKELILVGHVSGAPADVDISQVAAEINTTMNAQATNNSDPNAGTYVLTHPDLSAFTAY